MLSPFELNFEIGLGSSFETEDRDSKDIGLFYKIFLIILYVIHTFTD